jgi:hypothetical protein
MTAFAVIQEEYEKVAPETLAPVLERALGLVKYDAVRMAREGCGILAEALSEEQAAELLSALEERQVPARIIPQDLVVRIDKPTPVRMLGIADDALGVVWGYTGEPQPMAWDKVFLLSAGEVVETETQRAPRDARRRRKYSLARGVILGSPIQIMLAMGERVREQTRQPKARVRTTTRNQHLADIFAVDAGGEYRHIRLRSRNLYYEQILGKDCCAHFFDNFRLVLERIAAHASNARISPETETMMKAAVDPAVEGSEAWFGEESEFTQYNRWLLQMLALEGLGGAADA